jgi:hypothetical protein
MAECGGAPIPSRAGTELDGSGNGGGAAGVISGGRWQGRQLAR